MNNKQIPPRWNEIPEEIQKQFTLYNTIPVYDWWIDGTAAVKEQHNIDDLILKAKRRETNYYGGTDLQLYQALDQVDVKNKTVGVVGSTVPWYEAIVLSYGGIPITIEYALPGYNDKRIKEIFVSDAMDIQFDYLISISSVEHDGLGRYGDPINPTGDFRAMKELRKILNPDGLLFFAVPMGMDMLVWNAHRIYGKIRFPMLIKDWEIVSNFDEGIYNNTIAGVNPLVVLQ